MDDSQWMPPDPSRTQPTPSTGFEPVLPPPAPPSVPAPPVPDPAFGVLPDPSSGVLVEPVPTEAGQRRRRSKAVVGGAVVAVLALGGAGVFAVSQYAGESAGGAASPTELGNDLMAAIEQEDVLGMVDTLLPGERDVMRQPLIDLVSELTRLDILTSDADLTGITGFDVELADEAVSTQGTNVADIVQVEMTADATISVDGSRFPIGDLITGNMDPDDVAELRGTVNTSSDRFDASLTAVEDDGRWYFSLFHTAAEEARTSLDPVPDIPLQGLAAEGAESPEAAFNLVLDRLVALDIAGVIGALNPGEAAALQRYAPLFLDEIEATTEDFPVEIEITSRQLRSEGSGGTRTVFVDALGARGSFGPQGEQLRFELSLDGDCVTGAIEGDFLEPQPFEQCLSGTSPDSDIDSALADSPDVAALLDAIEEALADMQPVGVEVRQHDGAWYVSPTATVTEALLKVLRALDREEVDRLVELGAAGFAELADLALGGTLGLADDGFVETLDEVTGADGEWSAYPEAVDDPEGPTVPPATTVTGWERCYDEPDPQSATDCFQQYVDAGEITAEFVPVELRHAECGYAELRWTNAIYTLGDEQFVAAAQAAQPCFMALVAAGEVQEYELPYEITHLECFEGRNWYNTYGDPEYDARYWACIDGTTTSTVATNPAG